MSFLPYSLREGLAGFRRAKFASFTSTSAMAVALVLIGMFAILSYKAGQVSDWLRVSERGELEVYLDDNIEIARARALHERASATFGVANADYISSEQATRIFEEDFGEGADVFFDQPFLPSSIRVQVESRYIHPDSLNALIEEFKSWNRVDEVVFNAPVLKRVHENLSIFKFNRLDGGDYCCFGCYFFSGQYYSFNHLRTPAPH